MAVAYTHVKLSAVKVSIGLVGSDRKALKVGGDRWWIRNWKGAMERVKSLLSCLSVR
jgi:hypothetical protein